MRSRAVTAAKQPAEQKANVEAGIMSCEGHVKLCISNCQSTCERLHPCFLKMKAPYAKFFEHDRQYNCLVYTNSGFYSMYIFAKCVYIC